MRATSSGVRAVKVAFPAQNAELQPARGRGKVAVGDRGADVQMARAVTWAAARLGLGLGLGLGLEL